MAQSLAEKADSGAGAQAGSSPSFSLAAPTPATAPAPALIGPPTYPAFQLPTDVAAPNSYDQAFQSSLSEARSSVQTQLRNAISEINQNEQLGNQAVGALPGQYGQLYDMATKQIGDLGSSAEAAQKAAGVQSYTPQGSMEAPFLSTLAMARASQEAGVPLLSLGVRGEAQRQRAGVNQAGISALDQIGGEERSHLAQQADAQRSRALTLAQLQYGAQTDQYKAQLDAYNRQQDNSRQDTQRAQDFQNQKDMAQYDYNLQHAYQPVQRPYGAMEVSQERGAALQKQATYRTTKTYQDFVKYLRNNPSASKPELFARIDKYQKSHKKADTKVLSTALFDLYGPS